MDNIQNSTDREQDEAPVTNIQKWIKNIASWYAPHPSVQDIGEKRRAQLLNIVTLILAATFIIALVARPASVSTFIALLTLSMVSFILGKTKYYRIGAAIFSFGFLSTAFLTLFLGTATGFEGSIFSTVPIALVVASVLVGQREFLFLAIYAALATFLAPYYSKIPTTDIIRTGGIVLGIGTIIFGIDAFRASVERARLKEVRDVNKELAEIQIGLEKRVSSATSNLTLAAEVGHSIAQMHDLDSLLKDATNLIEDRFNLYYSQVYLLDPTGHQLVLRAGTGEAGQQLLDRRHSLPVDLASLNGTAAVEKRAVIVENTLTSSIHRPNPLLPDTRSEMVIPLLIGERVLGTLDMQSNQAGALNKENLAAFETLAGQLAIAVENANLLAETEAARASVEAQSRRLVRSGWQDFLNAVEHGERIGYTYDLQNINPFTEPISPKADGHSLLATIPVVNEPVGLFKFESSQAWSKEDVELVENIAHQLGQQVENLRLLAQADQYRSETENTLRQLTRQGWESEISVHPTVQTGFIYDLNNVSPLPATEMSNKRPMITQTLEILGEKIGELTAMETNNPREGITELLSLVGEQLSARVENLRLFEETQRSQVEVEKRARQLAAVAEVSTVSSRELDLDKMLASVVNLTQRQFGLYHAHIFLYDEKTGELRIAACGWKEGDEHEGTHETASILISQEQSLVARAARTRQAVIINDVHAEPGWLPNPLLPDTASEMAVPLIIGDQTIGVLDVQSVRLNAFSREDANIQTTLASQVAIALQNARSFAQAQHQAERETMLNVIGQKIRSATTIDAVLQIAARELGHALGAPLTIAQLGIKDK